MKKMLCIFIGILLLVSGCGYDGVVVSFPAEDSVTSESIPSMAEELSEDVPEDMQMMLRIMDKMNDSVHTIADMLKILEESAQETYGGEDITWFQVGNIYRAPMTYFEITFSRQYEIKSADSPMLLTCIARYPVMSLDKEWDLCFQSSDYETIEGFYQAIRDSEVYKKMADVEMEDFDIHGMLIPES